MDVKLIIDAGSTKVEWAVLNNGKLEKSFITDGLNALLADLGSMSCSFSRAATMIPEEYVVVEIFYYGAGCATDSICEKVKCALASLWPEAIISVHSDLLGAARSLFGRGKGVACILGTGSNSCLYDGEKIVCQIPSLGYVLGDEGSGAALGKRLISDAFKQQLPESVTRKLTEEYSLTLPDILEKVYRQPAPNKYLASFVPFLKSNLWNPYIYSLVLKELTRFVKRNVSLYKGAHSLELGFTGSIAFHFERILIEAASSLGYKVTRISEAPMSGLIKYHTEES